VIQQRALAEVSQKMAGEEFSRLGVIDFGRFERQTAKAAVRIGVGFDGFQASAHGVSLLFDGGQWCWGSGEWDYR